MNAGGDAGAWKSGSKEFSGVSFVSFRQSCALLGRCLVLLDTRVGMRRSSIRTGTSQAIALDRIKGDDNYGSYRQQLHRVADQI